MTPWETLLNGFSGAVGAACAGWIRYQDVKKEKTELVWSWETFVNTIGLPAIFGFIVGVSSQNALLAFTAGFGAKVGLEALPNSLKNK